MVSELKIKLLDIIKRIIRKLDRFGVPTPFIVSIPVSRVMGYGQKPFTFGFVGVGSYDGEIIPFEEECDLTFRHRQTLKLLSTRGTHLYEQYLQILNFLNREELKNFQKYARRYST